MLNRYPFWKYLIILGVTTLGLIYAAPNLYAPDPAIQISGQSAAMDINDQLLNQANKALKKTALIISVSRPTAKMP